MPAPARIMEITLDLGTKILLEGGADPWTVVSCPFDESKRRLAKSGKDTLNEPMVSLILEGPLELVRGGDLPTYKCGERVVFVRGEYSDYEPQIKLYGA